MKNLIQFTDIYIPTPCHENWSNMTQDEKGRFCASCQKTVYDFSDKTEVELTQIIHENAGKEVCGRFSKKQMTTPKKIMAQIPQKLRLFLAALALSFGVSYTQPVQAQNSHIAGGLSFREVEIPTEGKTVVSGVVSNKDTKKPIVGASVTLTTNDKTLTTTTNAKGIYTFEKVKQGSYVVSASAIGFETNEVKNISILAQQKKMEVNITLLEEEIMWLGEIAYEPMTNIVVVDEFHNALRNAEVTINGSTYKTNNEGKINGYFEEGFTIVAKGYDKQTGKLQLQEDNLIVLTKTAIKTEGTHGNEVQKVEENYNITQTYLSPNPISKGSTAQFKWKLGQSQEITFIITDLKGTTLNSFSNTFAAGEHQYNIPVQSLSTGIYLVNMLTTNQRITHKLVITE